MRATPSMFSLFLVVCAAAGAQAAAAQPGERAVAAESRVAFVPIPAGEYEEFYGGGTRVSVAAFEMQRDLVSVADFRRFMAAQPRWQPGRIPAAFAGAGYLRDLEGALPEAPVVNVSWFAARAYCASIGARLPTVLEWEYVAAASPSLRDASADAAHRAQLLERYTRARPARLPAAGSGSPNWYGVRDVHGDVREWVLDFNSVMVTDDSRSSTGVDRGLYCAAAATATKDASDYAAYLRYALRASLSARSTVSNVGFRCAR